MSEPRTETHAEELALVEVFLLDWPRRVEADRPQRRLPGDADAGRHANRARIVDRARAVARRVDVPQRAEIAEDAAADADLLRQPERHLQRRRADIVLVAAERVACDRIARP